MKVIILLMTVFLSCSSLAGDNTNFNADDSFWLCQIRSARFNADRVIYDEEVEVANATEAVFIHETSSNIRYALVEAHDVINFIVGDYSETKDDPTQFKPLVNVVYPQDQDIIKYIDHQESLLIRCFHK